jgi:DNA-binding NarL/FixJ family response regulator
MGLEMTIRVLLADDHPVVRAGLQGMFEADPEFEVVGQAASGRAAVELAEALRPDVVLLDLRMADMDGVTATERMSAWPSPPSVLILTTYGADREIFRAVAAGAAGYLLKDASWEELSQAVRSVARGETALPPPIAAKLVSRMRSAGGTELSSREVSVLGLVARGMTNAEIGRALHITEPTVKTYLVRVFTKLGVNDRTAAVTTAIRQGILSDWHAAD